MQSRKLTIALGLLSATMLAAPACAEDATNTDQTPTAQPLSIETVIVTARRRAENLEQIPVAVTALTPETLRVENVRSALDMQNLSPSLTVTANLGARDDNVFTIRGQSQPFGGADPGVQTYFNEVPFVAGGPANYYDMENIQVLRGPQGTLFGRNTTGGAVLFQPKKPTGEFGGYIDASGGDFAMGELQGAVNVPIIGDALAIRVAGDIASRKGFTKDVLTGDILTYSAVPTDTDLDNVHYVAFRVGVIARPFDGFENYAVFNYINDNTHGTGSALTSVNTDTIVAMANQYLPGGPYTCADPPVDMICGAMYGVLAYQQALGPRQTTSSIPLFYKRNIWSITDVAQYDITDNLHLRNILGYLVDKGQSAFDYDGSVLPFLDIPNPRTWEYNSRQITEEIQVLGEHDNWTWLAGFYYEHGYRGGYAEVEREVFGGANGPFGPLGFGNTEVDALSVGGNSLAVYGSATYDASGWVPGLSFTAGGRYTWDHKNMKSLTCVQYFGYPDCDYPLLATSPNTTSENDSASFRAPTWTISGNYQITEDTLLYGTYRRGYKSGSFNAGAAGTGYTKFEPEYLTDVELGTKNNWTILDVPGRTNFDLYYGWYNDIQRNDAVQVVTYLTFPPYYYTRPVVLTVNAAKANVWGLEFESTFIPDDNFQVTAFYSYTEATYGQFVLPQALLIDPMGNVTPINPLDHKGDEFAYTPKHKLGLTARFHLPVDSSIGMPFINATWYWQSKVWFTDFPDLEPHAFQSDYGIINLRLDWDSFLGSSFDASVFVNNLTNRTYKVGANALEHLIGTTASIYGPPRMVGVELRYRFGADAR